MEDRLKQVFVNRMRQMVANPPHKVIARDLLARGLTANEIYQLVVRDPAFDAVPYPFRMLVANTARELADQALLQHARKPAGQVARKS
jgi:hypothetical protein